MSVASVVDASALLHPRVDGSAEERAVVAAVARSGALLQGHFRLQGGSHSEYFLRFARVGWDEALCAAVAEGLVARLRRRAIDLGGVTVLSPESSGFFLGRSVARVLDAEHAVAMVDAGRCPLDRLRSGAIAPGARVLLVNDVVTSGVSLEALRRLAARSGASNVAAAVFASLDPDALDRWRDRHHVATSYLARGVWPNYPDGRGCPQCEKRTSTLPATEFN